METRLDGKCVWCHAYFSDVLGHELVCPARPVSGPTIEPPRGWRYGEYQ